MGPIEKEGPQAVHLRPTITATAQGSADRRRAIRRRASRDLDELLGIERPPLVLVDRGDYYRLCHLHLGVLERDAAGRELAGVR